MQPNVTIGVAGHIDHGKTALTKALTNIETDRLVEEKRRKISIENGYAFLDLAEDWRAAVIDVPGHERFIRQMIAGVAGIDLVLLVIAADEGVMPQTREHLDILRILGIPKAMIVITKIGLVDRSFLALVEEDVRQLLKGTEYEKAPFYKVDSLTGQGIEELKKAIIDFAKTIKGRSYHDPLRLPIDDVFTIHGHGTVVRGTVFNGQLSLSTTVKLLPQNQPVRIKQIQVHHEQVDHAVAGQRAAVNIGGIDLNDVKRGNVLVSTDVYQPTKRIDVSLRALESMENPLKQRGPITLHIGTATVRGKLIMYDRNRWEKGEAMYAQLELEEAVVAAKGDRFVIRRPTPAETLGGGIILNPLAEKHRFGLKTVNEIEALAKGTPADWIETALSQTPLMTMSELERLTNLQPSELESVCNKLIDDGKVVMMKARHFALTSVFDSLIQSMLEELGHFHREYPLRSGMNRAEWLRENDGHPRLLKEAASDFLIEAGKLIADRHIVRLADFKPHFPPQWEKRLRSVAKQIHAQGLQPESWRAMIADAQIPETLANDFRRYLIDQGLAFSLDDDRLIDGDLLMRAIKQLKRNTGEAFTVQEAKDILSLTRKNLIPLLELLDRQQITKREDNLRRWQDK